MKFRELGKTGLKISEIGFGAWPIGGMSYGKTRDRDSLEALETAWAQGVNFYDTADTYGEGHSEELLARFLKGKPRDKIYIATKAGWDFYHQGHRKNFDPSYIRFACEQSLKRLDLDTIDLYQLHNPSLEMIQKKEIVGVLDKLKKEGKIRYIGISLNTEFEALAAMEDKRIDTLQVIFNLLDQRIEKRVFDEANRKKIGILAREPLACGILSGKYSANHIFSKDDHRRRWSDEKKRLDHEKVQMIKSLLKDEKISLIQAALEYILHFKEVSTMIPGAKTKAQVLENLKASLLPRLTKEKVSCLKDLWLEEPLFKECLIPR